ncbi:MAG: CoA-binding protein, partial [Thermomicrobium sp.]|nr:CoA-binding protein [Thermomicrobium sp.]
MVAPSLRELLFQPSSIAVYGASADPERLSGRPLDFLLRFGYTGNLYAVNSRRESVQGLPAYSEIESIPERIDVAVIAVPAESVVTAIKRCANAGVRAAIIFASGFAEIGARGKVAQEEISAIARHTGMRIMGPNCLGLFAARTRVFATFSTAFDVGADQTDSPIAIVSQSGAVGTFTYRMITSRGLGVRYFANTGNQADVTAIELLTELADAPDVEILLGHIEAGDDLTGLERLARTADDRGKPLLMIKGGQTPPGARAVAAHTASDVGDDAAARELLTQNRAVLVDSMEELADAALAFASSRRAGGRRLTIVTQSGGAGALAADMAIRCGLEVETLSAHDRASAALHLPYYGSTQNPIDVTGSLINDPEILEPILRVVCQSLDTDVVLVVLGNCDRASDALVPILRAGYASTGKPFFVSWSGGSGQPRRDLLAAGVPTFEV